jgi:peptidoglycan LD-endopeptidase CwlK
MASRDLNDLIPQFRPIARRLIRACSDRGIEMRSSATLRSPFEQAKLWRQSRTRLQINEQIRAFRTAGADFLAFCLDSVGPQNGGGWATDAPPGLSWHQWGEALDCFWVIDGRAEWSTTKKINGLNGYHVYADEAERLGLIAGGRWPKRDWPHAQLSSARSPRSVHTILEINRVMKERFEGQG